MEFGCWVLVWVVLHCGWFLQSHPPQWAGHIYISQVGMTFEVRRKAKDHWDDSRHNVQKICDEANKGRKKPTLSDTSDTIDHFP